MKKVKILALVSGMFLSNFVLSADDVRDISMQTIANEIVAIRVVVCSQHVTHSEVVNSDPLYPYNLAIVRIVPSYWSILKNAMLETATPETCRDSELWISKISDAIRGEMH